MRSCAGMSGMTDAFVAGAGLRHIGAQPARGRAAFPGPAIRRVFTRLLNGRSAPCRVPADLSLENKLRDMRTGSKGSVRSGSGG